jgi:hypothetical protein
MNDLNYICLKKNNYSFENYQLIPIRLENAEIIRKWRNEQIVFLRQEKPVSSSEQVQYFEQIIIPTFKKSKPELILFSFLENSQIIGYGGLVNIDWDKKITEISFLADTDRTKNSSLYETDFSIFLNFLKKIACDELNFNELFTETYDIRPTHISILEKNGFAIFKREKKGKTIDGKSVDILFHSYTCNKGENT